MVNRVVSVISVVLRETTHTISVSTGEPLSMEYEIVRVVSLGTTDKSEITRLKIRFSGSGYLKCIFTPVLVLCPLLSFEVDFADNFALYQLTNFWIPTILKHLPATRKL